jgi:lysophospholipase L1-like esterase
MKMKKVFVIGDSVSCYYGKYLEPMLKGICEYDRKGGTNKLDDLDDCTDGINGGDSSMVLNYLQSVIDMEFFNPDYLLLNCGIHDTKIPDGTLQVPPEQYRGNLQQILKIAASRNIQVIWISTTPANDKSNQCDKKEVHRRQNDITLYNKIADDVMGQNNIPIIDLHKFTVNLGSEIYLNTVDLVHFNDDTAKLQAAFIAGYLTGEPSEYWFKKEKSAQQYNRTESHSDAVQRRNAGRRSRN